MGTSADSHNGIIGLYRHDLSSIDRLINTNVGREEMLDELVENLRQQIRKSLKQHYVFIGPRGIGKTHFLRMIEAKINGDDTLKNSYTVVRFPEENHRILSFADFLLGLIEIMGGLEQGKDWEDLHTRLEEVEDDSVIIDTILPKLQSYTKDYAKNILILLENLDMIFGSQIKDEKSIHQLRKFLMESSSATFIGTSPVFFEGFSDVKHPFYDFFDIQVIDELTIEQTVKLIGLNLIWDKRSDLLDIFETLVPKIESIHEMTGGNARLTLMLYNLIAKENILEVKQQFELLLDQISPFFQDRIGELAPQERAVLETIALMRSEYKTPLAIAKKMRKSPQQISSLLKRMTRAGYLSASGHPEDKRSKTYRIREGFFDLWLAMSHSRVQRKRLPYLVTFFAGWYSEKQEREKRREQMVCGLSPKQGTPESIVADNCMETLGYLSDVGGDDERLKSKLELILHGLRAGKKDYSEAALNEIRDMRQPNLFLSWMSNHADLLINGTASTDIYDQMENIIRCWRLHRTGDIEKLAALAVETGSGFSAMGLHELNIAFLKDQLTAVEDDPLKLPILGKLAESLEIVGNYNEALETLGRMKALASSVQDKSGEFDAFISMGRLHQTLADYQTALHCFETGGALARSMDDNEKKYMTMMRISQVHVALGNYANALELLEEVRGYCEMVLGEDNPLMAQCSSELASVHKHLGNYGLSKELLLKSIEYAEKTWGRDHASIMTLYSNLATVLRDLGDYAEAKDLLEKAVKSAETDLGPDHPATAVRYSNLASVLKALGDYAEAKVLLEKAVKSAETNLGPDHPETAVLYSNLASVLKALGDYTEAKVLLEKTVKSDNRNLGPDHPVTAVGYSNLASVLQALGDFSGARDLLEKAVKSHEKYLGPDHPATAVRYSNFAMVLQDLGDYTGARDLLEKAVKSDERNLGPDHPETAVGYSNLATVLQALGDYAGARDLLEKAVKSDENSLGPDHPETAVHYLNLAMVFHNLGDYEEALALAEKALAIFKHRLPEGHPHIQTAIRNLDGIKQNMNN